MVSENRSKFLTEKTQTHDGHGPVGPQSASLVTGNGEVKHAATLPTLTGPQSATQASTVSQSRGRSLVRHELHPGLMRGLVTGFGEAARSRGLGILASSSMGLTR